MDSVFSLINTVLGGSSASSAPSKELIMPWNDYKEQAQALKVKGKLDDLLKDEILEISNTEDTFLVFKKGKDSDIYDFVLDENVPLIMALLVQDENLNKMVAKLGPTRNNEELFWKSYFYKVEEVKHKTLMKFSNAGKDTVTG